MNFAGHGVSGNSAGKGESDTISRRVIIAPQFYLVAFYSAYHFSYCKVTFVRALKPVSVLLFK